MQKNNFMKNVMAVAMLLSLMMGMVSCQGLIDAVIGSEDKPVSQPTTKPETPAETKVTSEKTTITISSLEELANAVTAELEQEFVNAIKAKAETNDPYVIEIKSDASLSTNDFDGFELPGVDGADIVLKFDNPIATTAESPLQISVESASTTSTDAKNTLTIEMPDGTSGIYLKIDMPETTVKLSGNVTYELVEAVTAKKTLIVGEGITIKEAKVNGGYVELQKGGIIEKMNVVNTQGLTQIRFDEEGNDGLKALYIADGASVNFNVVTPNIETIIGQGDAKIEYGKFNESTEDPEKEGDINFKNVKKLNGVSVYPLAYVPLEGYFHSEGYIIYNIPDKSEGCFFAAESILNIGNEVKDCIFEVDFTINYFNKHMEGCSIKVGSMGSTQNISSVTFSNCKIEIKYDEPVRFYYVPEDKANSFTLNFDNCELSECGGSYIRIEPGEYTNYVPVLDENGMYVYEYGFTYYYRAIGEDGQMWSYSTSDIQKIPEEIRNQGETSKEIVNSDNPRGYYKELYKSAKYETLDIDISGSLDFYINLKNCTIGGSKATPDMIGIRHNDNKSCIYNIDGTDYVVAEKTGGYEKYGLVVR